MVPARLPVSLEAANGWNDVGREVKAYVESQRWLGHAYGLGWTRRQVVERDVQSAAYAVEASHENSILAQLMLIMDLSLIVTKAIASGR